MKPADLQVAHHAVQLPSLRMHYVEAGRGPLVVLLHGFPETWWSWRHQLLPLAEAGFRVVAPDLRGYGETDKHGPYDLDTTAGDVCALIESLGGERKARVVGHDWGGGVAWHLAATRPECCDRLVVLNCPHPSVMRRALLARPSLEQLRRSWYFFFFQLPLLPEWVLQRNDAEAIIRVLRASVAKKEHFSPDELRPFRDAIQRPGAARAMVGWYREAVRRGFRHPLRPPTEGLIEADALLIWGLEDPALSFQQLVPGTEQYAPKLQVREVPGAGHFVHAEAPEVVNPLLKAFLA
jgi:pimeloyl-ACP methyl ester carboxylesterase